MAIVDQEGQLDLAFHARTTEKLTFQKKLSEDVVPGLVVRAVSEEPEDLGSFPALTKCFYLLGY